MAAKAPIPRFAAHRLFDGDDAAGVSSHEEQIADDGVAPGGW